MTDITWTTEQRKLSDLTEWEHNPAEITDHDAQQLKRSIDKFGLALPLIANVNGGLIDGHQRKMVMLMLDGHLPSELVDVRIPSRELSEDERTELAVRLRKNVGDWNWDTLANEFEIDDLSSWGFTDFELETGGILVPDFDPVSEDEQPRLDQKKPVVCPECGHEFVAS